MCIAAILCVAAPAVAAPPIAELEARAADEPHNPYWAYELALGYHAEHDLDRAIPQYRRALELDPTNSLITTSLHTALTERRMLHDAFTQFASGVTLPHQNAAAAFNFGLVAEKQGLIEEAYFYYARYVDLAPAAPDVATVRERLSAIENAILHRKILITKLATSPARVQPGERATAAFSYRVSGYGRHNATGVIEQVSLFRDERETHRFRQRAIRPSDRAYNTTVEFLVPDDAAPGVYTLVASVIAGSRRDDQIAVFPIDSVPIEIPEPITAEEWEAQQAAAAEATEDVPHTEQTETGEAVEEAPAVDAQPAVLAAPAPPPDTATTAAVEQPADMAPAQTEAATPSVTEPSQPAAQEQPPTEAETPAQTEETAEKPAPAAEPAEPEAQQKPKPEPDTTTAEDVEEPAPASQPSAEVTIEDLPPEESDAGPSTEAEANEETSASEPESPAGAEDAKAEDRPPAAANVPD